MGGFAMLHESERGVQHIQRVYFPDLLQLFEDGTVAWPTMEDSDIDDRTQGDKLVKAIALLQIIWFIAQILSRVIDGLAVTTMELFTVGNVMCAVITYLAWWNKPNGVQAPIIIKGVAPSWVRHYSQVALSHPIDFHPRKSILVGLLIGFIFGSLHLVAWNFHFASTTERILWRISSVGVTTLSAILPLDTMIYDEYTQSYRIFGRVLYPSGSIRDRAVRFTSIGLYGLFRCYMFVEMFVGLRDVPVDVYKTVQWTQYFPFLG
jgi:hypothetical protein